MIKIRRNAARCRGCGFLLESEYTHDYRVHQCCTDGRVYEFAVDGGKEYLRRVGSPTDYVDASEYVDPAEETV